MVSFVDGRVDGGEVGCEFADWLQHRCSVRDVLEARVSNTSTSDRRTRQFSGDTTVELIHCSLVGVSSHGTLLECQQRFEI